MPDFLTTQWSLIQNAGDDAGQRFAAWVELYRDAMVHFLVCKGFSLGDAEDYVQGFLLRLVSDRKIFQVAAPNRGAFRDLLKASLLNFVRDQLRRASANSRHPAQGKIVSAELIEPESLEIPSKEADLAWDRAWALSLLVKAISSWRPECERSDHRRWGLFQQRYLVPFLTGSKSPEYVEIYEALEYDSAKQAANATKYIRQGIDRHLRQQLRSRLSKTMPQAESEELDQAVAEQFNEFNSALLEAAEHGGLSMAAEQGEPNSGVEYQPIVKELSSMMSLEKSLGEEPTNPNPSSSSLSGYDLRHWASIWLSPQGSSKEWTDSELNEQIAHVLVLPIPVSHAAAQTEGLQNSAGLYLNNLQDVFQHPNPPLELLAMLKDFMKRQDKMPEPIAQAVYLACITMAELVHGQRISTIDEQSLSSSCEQLLQETWLPESLHKVIARWLSQHQSLSTEPAKNQESLQEP